MSNDILATINFTDYLGNLRGKGKAKNYGTWSSIFRQFTTEITLTRSGIKKSFENQKYEILQEIFYGLPLELQAKYVAEFYKNLPILGTEKKYKWYNPFTFSEDFIKASTSQQLADNIQYILAQFKLTKKFLIELAKKLKDTHGTAVQEIYNHTNDSKLKQQLLKYLPSAAVALSANDLELREKAKKSLGLSKRSINYRNRVRQAFKKALEKDFKGSFTKNRTCDFKFNPGQKTASGEDLNHFEFSWASSHRRGLDTNRIYFSISFSTGTGAGVKPARRYYPWRSTNYMQKIGKKDLGLDCIREETAGLHSQYTWGLSIHKNDWEKLTNWVKKNLASTLRNQ